MLRTSFDPFTSEFDRIVERAFGWSPALLAVPAMPMDAIRRESDILLHFDLPGVSPETIDVTVDNDLLTVRAERKPQAAEGESYFIRERVTGTFTRRISLSDRVDAGHIEASYHDGVLTVRVPLAENAKPRKVAISTDGKKSLTA
jgi:HSP20 family protein